MSLFYDGIVGSVVNTPRGGGVVKGISDLRYTKTFYVELYSPVWRFLRKPVTHVYITFDNTGSLIAL